jgi:primosomal protein N' (replication factor Y)
MCDVCKAPLVLYLSRDKKKRMFSCNRCKKEKSPETTCSNCSSWDLVPLGIGTDTVHQEVGRIFQNVKIFKLDKESVKNNTAAEKIIQEFEETKGSILVGTEMAFFYMNKKVPLSIIASFDSLWSIPNFRMSERIVQLMISVISKTKEKLLIQTKNENDKAITSLINENLLSFVREDLRDRKNLGYPPYVRFIKINHLGDKEKTISAKELLNETFNEYNPEIFSGFISREKGKYSTNALIKIETKNWSLPEISRDSSIDQNLFNKLISLPSVFSITIDPEDLL